MPDCPGCGDSFGNAGALETHKMACNDLNVDVSTASERRNTDVSTASEAQPASATPEQEPAEPPARAQGQPQNEQNLPAQQGQSALETGMQVGQELATLSSGTREEQARSKASLGKGLAGLIASASETMAERELEGIERSKNASQDDLSVNDEYVECPDCGKPIENLPAPGTEFNCPHCHTPLVSEQ